MEVRSELTPPTTGEGRSSPARPFPCSFCGLLPDEHDPRQIRICADKWRDVLAKGKPS